MPVHLTSECHKKWCPSVDEDSGVRARVPENASCGGRGDARGCQPSFHPGFGWAWRDSLDNGQFNGAFILYRFSGAAVEQQTFIVAQFWTREVKMKVLTGPCSLCRCWGVRGDRSRPLSHSLCPWACGDVRLHPVFPVSLSLLSMSPDFMNISHIGLGPPPRRHSNLSPL